MGNDWHDWHDPHNWWFFFFFFKLRPSILAKKQHIFPVRPALPLVYKATQGGLLLTPVLLCNFNTFGGTQFDGHSTIRKAESKQEKLKGRHPLVRAREHTHKHTRTYSPTKSPNSVLLPRAAVTWKWGHQCFQWQAAAQMRKQKRPLKEEALNWCCFWNRSGKEETHHWLKPVPAH